MLPRANTSKNPFNQSGTTHQHQPDKHGNNEQKLPDPAHLDKFMALAPEKDYVRALTVVKRFQPM